MRRFVIGLALLVLAGCGGSESPVSPEIRAATFRWDTTITEKNKRWILEAVDQARPEARQLIDEIDGTVIMGTYADPSSGVAGFMQPLEHGEYQVVFNLAFLNGDRKIDRTTVVLHELGHVVDAAVVPPELRDELAAQLPQTGACLTADTGDCTAPAERFADTFAKWALRGAVSAVGAGYSVATPASLESWGMPLATLAVKLDVAAERT
jgi:hypothetical protein